MPFSEILLKGVKGVGTINLSLNADKKVHTFIGENGVGKTKLLESLFQVLLLSSHQILRHSSFHCPPELFVLTTAEVDDTHFSFPKKDVVSSQFLNDLGNKNIKAHHYPLAYLGSQNRGFIKHQSQAIPAIGTFTNRKQNYLISLIQGMSQDFSHLNMDSNIEQWFIIRAQSSNSYQKQEDNRVIELQMVLRLLHQLDARIDAEFLEISGDNRVFLKINNEKRQLSQLSTGFASILKIIQTIVAAYGNFTNETNLQSVHGIIFIDEIESHLHLTWQAKIISLLKNLFPNSHFYISTHSSVVLTQLEEGEAYRLERDDEGIVRSNPITAPAKTALINVLKEAFDVDLNKMKRERMSAQQQQPAKKQLLDLLKQEGQVS